MQLTFEHAFEIGAGNNPRGLHSPDEIVQVLFSSGGELHAKHGSTAQGIWTDLSLSDAYNICDDENVQHLRSNYSPGNAYYIMWESDDRHRWVAYLLRMILTRMIADGSIEIQPLNPVTGLSLSLENPMSELINEQSTLLLPGNKIVLNFQSGNSRHMAMGEYYLDRSEYSVGSPQIQLQARNIVGHALIDQSLDDDSNFDYNTINHHIDSILANSGIAKRYVAETETAAGMVYPHNTRAMDAINEFLRLVATWQVQEVIYGGRHGTKVCVGPPDDPEFNQPAAYTMQRGRDVFGRAVERDLLNVYSRVAVKAVQQGGIIKQYSPAWVEPNRNTDWEIVGDATVGWEFEVTEEGLFAEKLLYYPPQTGSHKVHLWHYPSGESPVVIATFTQNMVRYSWRTMALEEPIELIVGDKYMLSVNLPDADYYSANYSAPELDPGLLDNGAYYAANLDTYPTSGFIWRPLINLTLSRMVTQEDGEIVAYSDIDRVESWVIPQKKTLYIDAPTGTPAASLQVIADAVAQRVSRSGIVEAFTGPFRPHIQPGDTAQIVDPDGQTLIGVITGINHRFGNNGFMTDFTVDSGGVLSSEQITTLVEKLIRQKQVDTASRSY